MDEWVNMKVKNLQVFETQKKKPLCCLYIRFICKGLGHSTDCRVREHFTFPFCKLLCTYLVIFVLQRLRNLFRKNVVRQTLRFIHVFMLCVFYCCPFHKQGTTVSFFGKLEAVFCDKHLAIGSTVTWGAWPAVCSLQHRSFDSLKHFITNLDSRIPHIYESNLYKEFILV
jgi:hypothetical protein